MNKISNVIVDLLTDRKRKVPIIYINFNYQKFLKDGAEGSCTCSIHPDLTHDAKLTSMLNEVVDYIRDDYDMKTLVEL